MLPPTSGRGDQNGCAARVCPPSTRPLIREAIALPAHALGEFAHGGTWTFVRATRASGDRSIAASGGRKDPVAANHKRYTERQRDFENRACVRVSTQNHVQLVDEEQDSSNNEGDL
jgi:hypothetical protein